MSYRIIAPFRLDGTIRALRENSDGSSTLVIWNGSSWIDNPKGRLVDVFEEDAVKLSAVDAASLGAITIQEV